MSGRHRVLFYSHDSFGLGHFRRSLTIASYLSRHIESLSVLMLTGFESPAAFEAPPDIDFVKLPSIWKAGPDEYRSRHLRVSFKRVVRMREQLIRTVGRAFAPSMVVVDNVPRGVDGELLPMLRYLRKQLPQTRIILTLRDVLDAPENIVPQWRAQGIYDLLQRFYDEIWVVGSAAVFDPVQLYEMPPEIAEKVRYCGYVVRSSPAGQVEEIRRELALGARRLVVASCGGGGDGAPLLRAFVEAAAPLAEAGVLSAVFLGPDMPATERQELKQRLLPLSRGFVTFDFRPDMASFLAAATCSVSMAGYNTLCEIAARGIPALVVPREYPRHEQRLRAQAFSDRGLVHLLPQSELSPESLRVRLVDLLQQAAVRPRRELPPDVDFAGLSRIARRVRKHLRISATV